MTSVCVMRGRKAERALIPSAVEAAEVTSLVIERQLRNDFATWQSGSVLGRSAARLLLICLNSFTRTCIQSKYDGFLW